MDNYALINDNQDNSAIQNSNSHPNSTKKSDKFDSDYEKLMSERGKLMKGPPMQ